MGKRRATEKGGPVLVDFDQIEPFAVADLPAFIARGAYEDVDLVCADCGYAFVWTADDQKFWFEEMKSPIHKALTRCTRCLRLHDIKAEA
jgi:hypothetical protein